MRGRAVQDSFTCPSPAFRTHPHMRFFRSQKWTFIFTSFLPKQKQLFFRSMSGPPRAGHIWTGPGAWFFHLQFYKKYVIIFKKSKICRENFICCQVWIFYREGTVHNKRMEIRLTFNISFLTFTSLILWKIWNNIWEAKLASKILDILTYEHFIERGLFIAREWKLDLLSRNFFECGGQKIFLSRWVGIKMSPLNIIT